MNINRAPATDPKFFSESSTRASRVSLDAAASTPTSQALHSAPRNAATAVARDDAREAASMHRGELPKIGTRSRSNQRLLHHQRAGYASEAKWRVETLFLTKPCPAIHAGRARREIEGLASVASQANFNIAFGRAGRLCRMARLRPRVLPGSVPALRQPPGAALSARAARRRYRIHAYNCRARQGDRLPAQPGGSTGTSLGARWNRYFSNPAQALGYLLGTERCATFAARAENRSRRLQRKDIHSVVIDNGAMTARRAREDRR